MKAFSLVLPRRSPRQPQPCLNGGGDCGACALAGILGITVEDAYELHESGEYAGGSPIPKRSSFNIFSMQNTLSSLYYRDMVEGMDGTAHPLWILGEHHEINASFGITSAMQSHAWFRYVTLGVEAGYYALCQVNNDGTGGPNTNHWVSICGARNRREPTQLGGYSILEEVLVTDSALNQPTERWVDRCVFAEKYGGFMAMLVKPKA